MTLKRLPQDNLEDESILAVEGFFNRQNWHFVRQNRDQSGIDGELEPVSGIERSGRFLKCQVKAGRSYISSESDDQLRIRLERKYIDHWQKGNFPVVLLFYHPDSKVLYWKAIKEHIRSQPRLTQGLSVTCTIPFDKEREILTEDTLPSLLRVVNGNFDYENILCEPDQKELIWSNWFAVKEFPKQLWVAPTQAGSRTEITSSLREFYSFTVTSGELISLSNIHDPNCELGRFCDMPNCRPVSFEVVEDARFRELLKLALVIFARRRGLSFIEPDRFYFPPNVLRDPGANKFPYPSLKGRPEERTKIYIEKSPGGYTEYKHHAARLSFVTHNADWYLQIDPDWYFSYPYGPRYTSRDLGARVTVEKAGTFNKDYLYLLHFWRQFLSDCTDTIAVRCSSTEDETVIGVDALPERFISTFRFFNDYVGPKNVDAQ